MRDNEEILNKLDNIDFHDIPVEKISFKTNYSTEFIIDFALYDEDKHDYDYQTIKFIGIEDMKMDELVLNSKSAIEINSFDYRWDNLFEGEILFLLGFSQPSFVVKIKCQKVELAKTTMEK